MAPLWYNVNPAVPRWKYTVVIPQQFKLPELKRDVEVFSTLRERPVLATSRNGTLTIHQGYTFDGATCAPDFKKLMRAVVLHDLLCQLCCVRGWPISRLKADRAFFREAFKASPALATAYFAGIRIGGNLHALFGKKADADSVDFIYV